MENLTMRMHARIRAAAAVNPHFPVEDRLQAALDHVLDGATIWLALPAVEMAAVIGADALPTLDWGNDDGRHGDRFIPN
jgi:hypothetical protein